MLQKTFKLSEIAEYLGAELQGDPDCEISTIAPIEKATVDAISFIERSSFRKYLKETKAAAIILAQRDVQFYDGNKLIVKTPYVAYARLTALFSDAPVSVAGVHASAVIGSDCSIPGSVSIGANCVLGNNVKVGERTSICAGTVIDDNVVIGAECKVRPNVTVYYGVTIGDRVLIHSGAVLGADGFGMANENGVWHKINQLGGVVVGDDVEIGANTCVDRGALEDTVIGGGAKLDNLIQIAHNVKIGKHVAIAACAGIAGSAKIGDYCMIGGGASINGHLSIADKAIITGTSTVVKEITDPGIHTSGFYVLPHRKWMRLISVFYRLDEIGKTLDKLEEDSHE
ncbi:MAG: UDP-3-O-(3-hydroxymyristoyl)glucosamine N-acyltransferase [Gammaproteobacteria bacterium]|nr:UDP-3-O-(3-hydroxymyristoyl)glucosamine N-acyltransferase [Gammaproteobacteria bacterium]